MSFPTVNGMLIDTEDETSNNPTANVKGFFSGLAKAMIFRNDDTLLLFPAVTGNMRDRNERLGAGDVGVGVLYVREDPKHLASGATGRQRNPSWRHDLFTKGVRNVKYVRRQPASGFVAGFSTRKPCMRSGSSSSSSQWVSWRGCCMPEQTCQECASELVITSTGCR